MESSYRPFHPPPPPLNQNSLPPPPPSSRVGSQYSQNWGPYGANEGSNYNQNYSQSNPTSNYHLSGYAPSSLTQQQHFNHQARNQLPPLPQQPPSQYQPPPPPPELGAYPPPPPPPQSAPAPPLYYPFSQYSQFNQPPPLQPPPPPSSPPPPPPPPQTSSPLALPSAVLPAGVKEKRQSNPVSSYKKDNHKPPLPLGGKTPGGKSGRVETEDERRLRKKKEYEKQKQKEKLKQHLKESQNKVLQKTQKLASVAKGHVPNNGSHMGDKRSTPLLSGDRIENRLKKPTTFLCKMK